MINNKFNVEDKVRIYPVDWEGVVISVLYSRDGIEYKVLYFNNAGKAELEYFFENELELLNTQQRGEKNGRLREHTQFRPAI